MVPTLTTERLILRAPHRDDFEDIYQLGTDPEVMRYISFGKVQTQREARKDLATRIRMSTGNTGYWIIQHGETGAFIGWLALKKLSKTKDYEIGFRLMRSAWGKGYATEGSRKLLDYAFWDLGLTKVLAVAMPENKASRRVLEKLGLNFQGTGEYYETHCVLYSIKKEEFELV